MKKSIFKNLILALFLIIGVGQMWADTASWSDITTSTNLTDGQITLSGLSLNSEYYGSGTAPSTLTITAASGYTISGVSLTYTDDKKDRYGGTPSVSSDTHYSYSRSTTTGTISLKDGGTAQSSVSLVYDNKVRISAITVTYASSGGGGGGGATTHTVTAAVNYASYGSASAASTTVAEGSTTTITATPNSGYRFVSWAVSGAGSTLSSTTTNPTTLTMGTDNTTVTATFEAIPTHTISYTETKSMDNSANPTSYTEGVGVASFTKLRHAVGYDFTGWSPSSISSSATTNQTIEAQWSTNAAATGTASLTYALAFGSGTVTTSSITRVNGALYDATDVSLAHTSFADKTNKTGCSGKLTTTTAKSADNYTEVTFKIADGYTFTPTEVRVQGIAVTTDKTIEVELKDNAATPNSKSVLGTLAAVQTPTDGGYTVTLDFDASGTITLEGTVTVKIFAYGATDSWRIGTPLVISGTIAVRTYTVSATADPAGYGTLSASSISSIASGTTISTSTNVLTVGESSITATAADNTDAWTYAFSNWTKSDGTALPSTVTADLNVYANFTRTGKSYTITLDKQVASNTPTANVSATYGSAMPSIAMLPSHANYTFGGFYSAAAGGGTCYYDNEGTSQQNSDFTDASTLYAKFTQDVTLHKNGGSDAGSATATYAGTVSSISEPTYSDHTIDGYYAESGCTNLVMTAAGVLQTSVTDGSSVVWTDGSSKWKHAAASTLYAHWKCDAPSISCSANTVTITIPSGATVYYTTDGSTPDAEAEEYTDAFIIDEDVTVKAIAIQSGCTSSEVASADCDYSSAKYNVTYAAGVTLTDGDVPEDDTDYSAGAKVTVLGNTGSMTYTDYTFRGWTYGDYFYKAGDSFTMPANNVTFTAVWDGGEDCETLAEGTQNAEHTAITATTGTITTTGSEAADSYIKLSGANSNFTVTSKTGKTISAGDKLTVTVYNKSNSAQSRGFKIGSTSHTASIAKTSTGDVVYTLVGGDISEDNVIITRTGSDDRYHAIKVERCTKSNFTVSFDDQTGFAGSSTLPNDIVGVPTGKKILQPSNPTATGYTFGGWYSDAACSNTFSFSGTITKDTTIYAKWTATPFSITYSDPSNGSYTIQVADGEASSETKENANCGQTITLAATPEANYIFTTWTITKTSDESDVTDAVSLSDQTATATFTMPAYGVKITATFERVYTLSYNAHGGSGAPSGDSYIAGAEITLSGTKPTNTGYSFNSWNTEENGGGDSYAAGADFTMPAENVTLYAQWDIVELSDNYASVTMTGKDAAVAVNATKLVNKVGQTSDNNTSGYKLNSSDAYFGLTLSSGNFRAGDKIIVDFVAAGTTLDLCLATDGESFYQFTELTSKTDYKGATAKQMEITDEMVDPEGSVGLTNTIAIKRTGTSPFDIAHFVRSIKVERTHCPECITLKSGTTTWSSTASDWIDKDGVASALPTIEDVVLLDADVTITAGTTAKAKGVVIADERSLTVAPTGALIVAETLTKNGTATTASDVELQSSSSGTAALIVGGESTNTQATVGFYTKAKKDDGKYINQYIGVPFASMTTYDRFYGTYLYSFDVATDSWKVVPNNGDMYPFTAYNLLRKETSETTFYSGGTLVLPGTTDHKTKELTMTKRDGEDKTENMFANSWTAPIDIKAMEESDFVGAEATIYIFNAGTYAQQQAAKETMDNNNNTNAGQWVAIPVEAADYTDWALTVIPSQQAFLVYTDGTGGTYKLTLDYEKHVYNPAVTSGAEIKPTRAPRRTTDKPEVMSMRVAGESGYADVVYMFFREDFSDGFDNGWDGRKMEGSSTAPQMYAYSVDGKMAIHATAEAEGTLLGFKAGNTDNLYTVTFSYEGDETYYLNDLQEQESALIEDENTYMFYATPEDDETRFVVSKTPIHKIATDVEGVGENPTVRKLLIENQLFIIRSGRMYGVDGSLVK